MIGKGIGKIDSSISDVIIYTTNETDLKNLVYITPESNCPLCDQVCIDGISISVQYNYGDWNYFNNVCDNCHLAILQEINNDYKNFTGFKLNP